MERSCREPRRGAGSSLEREAEEGSLREDPVHTCAFREVDLPAPGENVAPDIRRHTEGPGPGEDDRRQGVEGPAWEGVRISG